MAKDVEVRYRYNEKFTPEFELKTKYEKCLVESYAGKLLESMGSRVSIVYLDNDDMVHVLEAGGRLQSWFDFEMDCY